VNRVEATEAYVRTPGERRPGAVLVEAPIKYVTPERGRVELVELEG